MIVLSNIEINLTDNSGEVLKELESSVERALERIGMKAETYAAALTPVGTPESTNVEGYHGGRLRQSITHTVLPWKSVDGGRSVIIGSNLFYAPYVELGTGIYATDGNGRKSPWVWIDQNNKGHWTHGIEPQHMIKNAIEQHVDEYRDVIKEELQK